jgi:hypothetical protein
MSRVNTILGMVLSFAFIMAGSQKITDSINPATHNMLADKFKTWGPVSFTSRAFLCATTELQLLESDNI